MGGMRLRGEPESFLLNIAYVERRFRELDLKQWWVAEQIGVNRQTVMRWFTGQVKRARLENIERLAQCLDCPVEVLIAARETDVFATPKDQKNAAELIIDDDLYNLCRKERKLTLLESIARSVMAPNLPLGRLGELHLLLAYTRVCFCQYQEGWEFAEKALTIARKIGDESMAARARSRKAVALASMGRVREAEQLHTDCLKRLGDVDLTAKKTILLNAGVHYASREVPDFTLGMLADAEDLDPDDPQFLLTITRLRGRAWFQKGDLGKAMEEFKKALALARESGDRNEEFHTRVRLHECLLRLGRVAEAAEMLTSVAKLASRLKSFAVQVHYRQMIQFNAEGRHAEALGLIGRLRRSSDPSPLVRRVHLVEIARTYAHLGREEDVVRTLRALLDTFSPADHAAIIRRFAAEFPIIETLASR